MGKDNDKIYYLTVIQVKFLTVFSIYFKKASLGGIFRAAIIIATLLFFAVFFSSASISLPWAEL